MQQIEKLGDFMEGREHVHFHYVWKGSDTRFTLHRELRTHVITFLSKRGSGGYLWQACSSLSGIRLAMRRTQRSLFCGGSNEIAG